MIDVPERRATQGPDGLLLLLSGILLAFGLVMVASASVFWSATVSGGPWHVFERQLLFSGIGLIAGFVVLNLPLGLFLRMRHLVLVVALALLALVLVPGVGRAVNGSMRWLPFGLFRMQASEPALLLIAIYLAGYGAEQGGRLAGGLGGLVVPLLPVGLAAVLLLLEPDFGGAAVLLAMAFTVFFLAGARFRDLLILFLVGLVVMVLVAVAAPYRVIRLTTFLDPWHHARSSGFQLVQSLIAIGHGGWLGTGLGRGIEKLFYLPEPESDFIFAVIGEELGFVGMFTVLIGFAFLTFRIFWIGRGAEKVGRRFEGLLCYAIGSWIGFEVLINAGVNLGALPTKGITLPLISAGGSNLIMTLVALALVLNVSIWISTTGHRRPAVGEREHV
jgi:cell division protein FtsW